MLQERQAQRTQRAALARLKGEIEENLIALRKQCQVLLVRTVWGEARGLPLGDACFASVAEAYETLGAYNASIERHDRMWALKSNDGAMSLMDAMAAGWPDFNGPLHAFDAAASALRDLPPDWPKRSTSAENL